MQTIQGGKGMMEDKEKLLREIKAFYSNLNSGWYRKRIEIINQLREIISKNDLKERAKA